MSIFQKSVINNHLLQLDSEKVDKVFEKFNENYSFSKIAEIQKMKEEEYQDGFLRDIFVDILGYTLKPDDNHNLAREFKNQTDGKKADGAILKNDKAIAVIELKSTKTKELTNVTQQAFNYKNNQPECKYVITSNFQKLRFYIDYSNEYEEFDLFNLQKNDFQLLYLLLQKDSIFTDLPLKLKTETKFHEENISDKLYKDYSSFKYKIYNNLVKNNPQYDKLTLFKKSQKFLDRLLFVFFAEDTGLVPPNAISKIVEQWQLFIDNDEYFSLYSRFVKFFIHLDKGHKYKTYNLPAYNGGLFASDEILDNIIIDDDVLQNDALLLSSYDYSTEVDVNILGHIFEHSLNEIEEITAEIEGKATDKNKTKRKKDGVFYTPKYITQYIVENTIGKLCTEKREKFGIREIEFDESIINKNGKVSAKGKKLFETLQAYKDWLFNLKIVDPACGSGAFLNQALNFLIIEHQQIDDIIAELTGEKLRLFDTDKTILEKNLYGVDINDESVEIAKLSLWLRTTQKGRKLSNLNNNIKCGNSLIDDPEVAGEKAFNWQNEFPQIFRKKEKKIWHITTATHNSRYSQRMFDCHITTDKPEWIDEEDEQIITQTVADIVKEDGLNVLEYNLCGDHLHLLLVCEADELTAIVGKIKSVTAKNRNRERGYSTTTKVAATDTTAAATPPTTRRHAPLLSDTDTGYDTASPSSSRGETQHALWTQKFGKSEVKSGDYLANAIEYIRTNRTKHELPENPEIEKLKKEFLCTLEHALRTEYDGGFDVVLGNPPYGAKLDKKTQDYLNNKYIKGGAETAISFIKLSYSDLLKDNGSFGYIIPKSFSFASNYQTIREFILDDINKIIDCKKVWKEVKLEQIMFFFSKRVNSRNYVSGILKDNHILELGIIEKETFNEFGFYLNGISEQELKIAKNINKSKFFIKDIATNSRGGLFQKHISNNGDTKVLGGAEIQREGIKGVKGYIDKSIIESNEKCLINDNSVLTQNIVAHIENPVDHIKITACIPEKRDFVIVDTINQITFNEKYNAKVFCLLFNSKLINWYSYRFIIAKAIRTIHFDSPITNRIPVPLNIEQSPFIVKADQMLSYNKELQEKAARFINRIISNLEIEKISTKLEEFYDYDFKIFVAELKKQKLKLSLVQQDEWEEYILMHTKPKSTKYNKPFQQPTKKSTKWFINFTI